MAIDKKLQIFDDEGNPVDYDILANDVKFLPDGKDLPTKLAEMEDEIGEGGYTPPQGGIPKTDLEPSVQQTLDDVANKVDKLLGKGLSTNDYTTDEKSKLGNLPTVDQLTQQMSTKANSTEVVKSISVNGQTQSKDTNGNVNVVVPTVVLDDAPTAGSPNGVKSGGVKTALDNLLQNLHIVNGEWYIGNTATGVSAQGPAGNVNISDASDLVTILVNDLTTGGAGNILTAEMGKVLKIAVQTLLDSLGEYCFPNGRPTLSWEGPKCNVTQNLTDDVTSNFSPNRIDKNGSLEITLSPVDNLHVFLTGDVTVEMPLGTDITSTAWNANTGKVTIADVTDDVVITAKSSTYAQSGLVLHLDGLNRGGVAGHWKSLVNYNNGNGYNKQIDFTFYGNPTEATDHVEFTKGSDSAGSWGVADVDLLDVAFANATIEVLVKDIDTASNYYYVLANGKGDSNVILFAGSRLDKTNNEGPLIVCVSSPIQYTINAPKLDANSQLNGGHYSAEAEDVLYNGSQLTITTQKNSMSADSATQLSLCRINLANLEQHFGGKVYFVRIYSRKLTSAERALNYAIDQKRFNMQ